MFRYRRIAIFCILGVLCIFGKSFLKEGFLQCVSWGIERTVGGTFSCKDICYAKGCLIFTDVLFQAKTDGKNRYQIESPQVFLKFSWKNSLLGSLEIFQPQIFIDAKPTLSDFSFERSEKKSQKSWIHWSWKLFEGKLHWPEMGLVAQIDQIQKDTEELFQLDLVSGLSKLQIKAKGSEVFAHFSHWDLLLLQPWIELGALKTRIEGGFLEGSIDCNWLQDDLVKISSKLDLTDLFLKSPWGEISLARASFQGDNHLDRSFLSKSPLGWIRCDYSNGAWREETGSIEEIEGSFFYSSDSGMIWQGSAEGCLEEEKSPIAYSMKGFWADHTSRWLEIESRSSEGECFFQSDFKNCSVKFHQIQPFWGRFALSFYGNNCPLNLNAKLIEIHFDLEKGDGNFLIDGLSSEWLFDEDQRISVSDCHFSGFLLEGEIDRSEGNGIIAFKEFFFPCHLNLVQKNKSDWKVDGLLAEHPFQIEAFKKEDANGILMDFRLRRGLWDLARLVFRIQDGRIFLDPLKTEILGSEVKKEKNGFSLAIPASCTYLLQEFGVSSSLLPLLSGSLRIDFLYEKDLICRWLFRTDQLYWEDQVLPYLLQIDQIESGWQVVLQKEEATKELLIQFLAIYDDGIWILREGKFQGKDPLSHAFSGVFSGQCNPKGLAQISLNDCIYELKTNFQQMDIEEEKISMQGKGCITFDLASFDYEMDGDFSKISLEAGNFVVENTNPIHAFFSPSKGCMIQGIDSQVFLNKQSVGACQIKLLHACPSSGAWLFHEAHLHVPETSFSKFFESKSLENQWSFFDLKHDIDFIADIQGNLEFSIFSLSLKEGLLPWKGELKHIQNLEFYLDEKEVFADFFYVHQNKDVQVTLKASRLDPRKGILTLQDPEYLFAEGEKPLEVHWRYEPHLGVAIDSMQGNFAGVDLAFYLQATDYQSHLVGNAKIDFQRLSLFVPPLIAEFFTELKMGKGYEMKGKLHIDQNDLSKIFFTGQLTGKEIELCGYQFRTFLAQIDIKPEEVKLFDLKISDSSGFFKTDTIVMQGKGGGLWTFQIPLLSFLEFRPSLLRAVGEKEGTISPLVIREMHFRNIQGFLEDRNTYTAEGELYFINSYKRQRTLFDVPSDVLSRLIGLDIELLVPVRGSLRYVLKDGFFQITSLEQAFSESSRSQFFLADKTVASLDLDGNLQLAIKMKQYVLFKLTESFTILIDGQLKNPRYRLQKKK